MAIVYTSAKCPHCGDRWALLDPDGPNTLGGKIGPPVLKCGACLKDVETGYKFIRDLNIFEKLIYVYLKQIFAIILSMVFLYMAYFITTIDAFRDLLFSGNFVGIVFGGGVVVYFLYFAVMGIKNNINIGDNDTKAMEELYDANGGFLWSYEFY